MTENRHDKHYQRVEPAREPILIIEELNRMMPPEMDDDAKANIMFARKYVLRIGLKGDYLKWNEDIDKAINYLTRAKTGAWPWEQDKER